jgi:hypothetical protein
MSGKRAGAGLGEEFELLALVEEGEEGLGVGLFGEFGAEFEELVDVLARVVSIELDDGDGFGVGIEAPGVGLAGGGELLDAVVYLNGFVDGSLCGRGVIPPILVGVFFRGFFYLCHVQIYDIMRKHLNG